jgi:hypothetical protein
LQLLWVSKEAIADLTLVVKGRLMSFERYCGMASAAAISLVITLNVWLGVWGPLWKNIGASDLLMLVVAIVGWVVAITLGLRAFRLAQHQIGLAQRQIEQQQEQINEAREETRKSNYTRLDREFYQFARDIDRLMTAQGYLGTFSARFPQGQLDGWARALIFARNDAADFISHSAVTAPFGHGERVSTVMTRIQRLGDALVANSRGYMPDQNILQHYDPIVKSAIEGIRTLEKQVADDIPIRRQQLCDIANERDTYALRTDNLSPRSGYPYSEKSRIHEPA